jgi:hypothetical protein
MFIDVLPVWWDSRWRCCSISPCERPTHIINLIIGQTDVNRRRGTRRLSRVNDGKRGGCDRSAPCFRCGARLGIPKVDIQTNCEDDVFGETLFDRPLANAAAGGCPFLCKHRHHRLWRGRRRELAVGSGLGGGRITAPLGHRSGLPGVPRTCARASMAWPRWCRRSCEMICSGAGSRFSAAGAAG